MNTQRKTLLLIKVLTIFFILGSVRAQASLSPGVSGINQGSSKERIQGTSVHADTVAPLIENVTHSPKYPMDRDRVIITVTVTDNGSGIEKVILICYEHLVYGWYGQNWGWGKYEWSWLAWDVKTDKQTITMTRANNSVYKAELLELPYMTKVSYQVYAYDNAGNVAVSDVQEYYVVRGGPSIIYTQVIEVLNWIVYLSVALILITKIRRE